MSCPSCGLSRTYNTETGCNSCGYNPTRTQKAQEELRLLALVRKFRALEKRSIEWAGQEEREEK